MDEAEFPAVMVRPAAEDDLEAINAIYNFYVATSTATFDINPLPLEERRRWFDAHGKRYPITVAATGGGVLGRRSEGEVVGWCSLSRYHVRPAHGWTVEDSVYIKDAWRGRGIGRLLLADILTRARDLGYHAVIARIGDSANEASQVLHARAGFQRVGIEREVGFKFGRWLDVVVMQWQGDRA